MPKINVNAGGQRRHVTGFGKEVVGGFAQKPKPDKRLKGSGRGEQGLGECSGCHAVVARRKVSYGNPSRMGDLPVGTLVAGSHRAGGGVFSARRGDVLCPGASTKTVPIQTGE